MEYLMSNVANHKRVLVNYLPIKLISPAAIDSRSIVGSSDANNFTDHLGDSSRRCHLLLLTADRTRGRVTHKSHIFTDVYVLPSYIDLADQAKRSRDIDNAGGKSDVSEMFSIDYMIRSHGAHSIIFETEVQYWITYKMVDFICTIDTQRVGVSVARAMAYPTPDKFTSAMASRLLYKKLYGLIVARNAVSEHQSFYRSILHIWCQSTRIAELMQTAFSNLDNDDYGLDVKGIVILQLTVCDDIQLYKNRIM